MQDEAPVADQARRRTLVTYFVAVALTSVAYIATFQNAAVLAPQITGTAATGGIPTSTAVAGTALAAVLLSSLMASRGRRTGIVSGIGLAVIGCALMLFSVPTQSFLLLIGGSILTGFGNAAINLTRYAAADLFPPQRRAWAVGIVVWGSTLGAVAGPNLAAPANAIGEGLGMARFAGGFAMALIFLVAAAAIAALGPRAPAVQHAETGVASSSTAPRTPARVMLAGLFASTRGRTAVAALVSGQLVMVLIMTMTPYHLNHAGHGDAIIGLVISAHTFGMFALSPVSGRLAERFGAEPVIMAGFGTLGVAGILGAAAPADGGAILMLPLFLLGFGWNMTFVSGSSLLATDGAYADRARLQGMVDGLTWGTAALAGVSAGFVVAWAGYGILCLAGAGLAALLASVIALDGRVTRSAQA